MNDSPYLERARRAPGFTFSVIRETSMQSSHPPLTPRTWFLPPVPIGVCLGLTSCFNWFLKDPSNHRENKASFLLETKRLTKHW